MPQGDILCHYLKPPVPGKDYMLLNCWSKGLHGNPQTSQTIAKAIKYPSKPGGKARLLKTPVTYGIPRGKIQQLLNYKLHPN